MNQSAKNLRIRGTLEKTREKRRTQICKSYVLKIDKSHLSTRTREHLRRLFLEAKWFYNHILAWGDIWNADYKITRVLVKVKDGSTEERELKYLSSQMRQEIVGRPETTFVAFRGSSRTGTELAH